MIIGLILFSQLQFRIEENVHDKNFVDVPSGGEGGLDVFCLGRQRNNLGTGLTKGPGGGRKSWAQLLFNELCEIFQKNVFMERFYIITKRSILDVAAVLAPPLIFIMMTNISIISFNLFNFGWCSGVFR